MWSIALNLHCFCQDYNFMGPVSILYISFASLALFICLTQLYFSYRRQGNVHFLVNSVLSLAIFIKFSFIVLCATEFGISCPPFTLLKVHLISNQLVFTCMLGALVHLLKVQRQAKNLIPILILVMLMIITIFIPDEMMFGESGAVRRLVLTHGDHLLMIATGYSFWRSLMNFSVLVFIVSSFVILLKKMNTINFQMVVIIFSGLGLIVLTALFDQLVDLDQIDSTYMLPYAIFIFYLLLIFIPSLFFISEVITHHEMIEEEKKWLGLIQNVDLIVVELNRMGIVENINPYFYKLTGYSEEEVVGKDWFEFFIPSKEYYKVQGAFVEILEFDFHSHYLNPILTRNHEEKMIRWFNVRTLSSGGSITGSISIGVDVTNEIEERNSLEKKLAEAEKIISNLEQRSSHNS